MGAGGATVLMCGGEKVNHWVLEQHYLFSFVPRSSCPPFPIFLVMCATEMPWQPGGGRQWGRGSSVRSFLFSLGRTIGEKQRDHEPSVYPKSLHFGANWAVFIHFFLSSYPAEILWG